MYSPASARSVCTYEKVHRPKTLQSDFFNVAHVKLARGDPTAWEKMVDWDATSPSTRSRLLALSRALHRPQGRTVRRTSYENARLVTADVLAQCHEVVGAKATTCDMTNVSKCKCSRSLVKERELKCCAVIEKVARAPHPTASFCINIGWIL